MALVTLWAQPRKHKPVLYWDRQMRIYRTRKWVRRPLSLTDVGQAAWKAAVTVSPTTKLRLEQIGKFEQESWRLRLSSGELSIVMETMPYMFFGLGSRFFALKMEIDASDSLISEFVGRMQGNLAHEPWKLTSPARFQKKFGIEPREVEEGWDYYLSRLKSDATAAMKEAREAIEEYEASGLENEEPQDQIKLGVQALQERRYTQALRHAEKAITLSKDLLAGKVIELDPHETPVAEQISIEAVERESRLKEVEALEQERLESEAATEDIDDVEKILDDSEE